MFSGATRLAMANPMPRLALVTRTVGMAATLWQAPIVAWAGRLDSRHGRG